MSRIITFSKAINEALHQEMEHDEKVFIMGEDVAKMGGDFGITTGIWKTMADPRLSIQLFPNRPLLAFRAGAAICGLQAGGGADVRRFYWRVLRSDRQ